MNKLTKEIIKLPKVTFSLADLRKLPGLQEEYIKTTLSRALKAGEVIRLAGGLYSKNSGEIALENLAINIYNPSYLSFESALNFYNILSQQSTALTLATTKRAKKLSIQNRLVAYRHLKQSLFWGYKKNNDYLLAEPEKAFLDLAYLSLNGYGHFDPKEMNLKLLDIKKLRIYLKRFKSAKLEKMIDEIF